MGYLNVINNHVFLKALSMCLNYRFLNDTLYIEENIKRYRKSVIHLFPWEWDQRFSVQLIQLLLIQVKHICLKKKGKHNFHMIALLLGCLHGANRSGRNEFSNNIKSSVIHRQDRKQMQQTATIVMLMTEKKSIDLSVKPQLLHHISNLYTRVRWVNDG